MKLYFENSSGQRRLIATPKTAEESWNVIYDFCNERNFKIHYVRTWAEPNGEKYYDVGSHTEFFIETDDNDKNNVQFSYQKC